MTSLENGRSDLKLEKGGHLGGPRYHENQVPPKAGRSEALEKQVGR